MGIFSSPIMWATFSFLCWFAVFYLYHGLGITLGYHRLLTHKSLKVPRWLEYLIVSGGYTCLMGSPAVWVGVHRLHHQKSDLPGDPHSPRDGFMHALVGWMFNMSDVQSEEELQRQAGELMNDPVYRWLGANHKAQTTWLCLGLSALFNAVIFFALGLPGLIANLAASFGIFWSTQLVNSVCHWPGQGYRSFKTREDSRNVWYVGLLALGEGWHNNHHAVPKSARHGMEWFEVDVTWYAIWILEKVGLAKNVIRAPKVHHLHKSPATVRGAAKPAKRPEIAIGEAILGEIHLEPEFEPVRKAL